LRGRTRMVRRYAPYPVVDQPASVAGDPTPFRTLVAHTGRQLEKLAESNGGQVDLIAHSFGGQIAAALAREYPALIRRITLLGCPHDLLRAFFLFARRLLEAGYERPACAMPWRQLKKVAMKTVSLLDRACYPESAIPGIYFGSGSVEARDRYSP